MKSLQVFNFNGVDISIIPSQEHSFLITTSEVAKGYEVSESTIRRHLQNHSDELLENTHYFYGVQNLNAAEMRVLYWTKQGVILLGFFIRSERAKLFRKWASNLILNTVSSNPMHSSFNGERITLTFESTAITIILSDKHGFYISAKDIDRGYALYNHATRRHLRNNQEFIKGTDYITAGDDLECLSGYRSWQIFLTKKCAINISKYIKTNKALSFKNWLLSIDLSTIANCGTRGSPSYNKGIDIEEAKALAYLIYKGISKDINKDDLLHSSIKTLANKLNNSLNIIK